MYLKKTGGTLSGRINMNNNLIIGLSDPTGDGGAAMKRYVDSKLGQAGMTQFTADNRYLSSNGGGLKGALNMNHNRIFNLPKATDNEDATSVAWFKENTLTPIQVENKINQLMPKGTLSQVSADKLHVTKSGSTMNGPLSMLGNQIELVKDPVNAQDASNKRWVEAQIPKGLWHLVAYVKGSPSSHTIEYKNDDVLSITY